uniref:Uncharacterized protein n=1 Tax=viral metagenome TaxID=1070528 RepID=A0A6C0BQ42_9ZZZZ
MKDITVLLPLIFYTTFIIVAVYAYPSNMESNDTPEIYEDDKNIIYPPNNDKYHIMSSYHLNV